MNLEIRKLTPELIEDWLLFFDNTACSGANEWAGCYCMAPHWSAAMESEKPWEYTPAGAVHHRECAVDHINRGILQGWLAYADGKVGWCNANDKRNYDSIFLLLPWEDGGKEKKVKAIACFFVDPAMRGEGVATHLLDVVCADAAEEGCEYVEAYPFVGDANMAFTGPAVMYENSGFTLNNDAYGPCAVCRKYL